MSDWVGFNDRYLTSEEKIINAQYILNYLLSKNWTKNSICGMLGNMEKESTLNPLLWESFQTGNFDVGFGLVQWTPSTKLINWCNSNNLNYNEMDSQLNRILWEVDNGDQWINNNLSFSDFTKSTSSPDELAMIFLNSYERPLDPNQPDRGTQAIYWYDTLNGGQNVPINEYVKLIYPYTFSTLNKISFTINKFKIINDYGNTLIIKEDGKFKKYRVNKSYVKSI